MIGNVKKVNKNYIEEKLKPIFLRHNVKSAILFGSVAKDMHNEYSDIDIMVDSNLKGLKFFGLLEDIVNILESDVDLIDKSQIINNSLIEKEINNTGVSIYGWYKVYKKYCFAYW